MLRPLAFALGLAFIGTAAAQPVPPPPSPPPIVQLPTAKEQCFGGNWATFKVFKNQGDCVSYIATKGKNPPVLAPDAPPPPPPPPR